MEKRDYYEVLGVSKDATADQIKMEKGYYTHGETKRQSVLWSQSTIKMEKGYY